MFEDHIIFSGFSVDDLDAARRFYGKILGLSVKDQPMGHLELHIQNSTPMVIYPKKDHQPASFTVLNILVRKIEESVAQLRAKGICFEQYNGELQTDAKGICRNVNGPKLAWFKDPAGNIISLIEDS